MKYIIEPTEELKHEWNNFLQSLPEWVRDIVMSKNLVPWHLYRLKTTGQRVQLQSFDSTKETQTVTAKVAILAKYNPPLISHERMVFGIDLDDLEPCEPPEEEGFDLDVSYLAADILLGLMREGYSLDATHVMLEGAIEELRQKEWVVVFGEKPGIFVEEDGALRVTMKEADLSRQHPLIQELVKERLLPAVPIEPLAGLPPSTFTFFEQKQKAIFLSLQLPKHLITPSKPNAEPMKQGRRIGKSWPRWMLMSPEQKQEFFKAFSESDLKEKKDK